VEDNTVNKGNDHKNTGEDVLGKYVNLLNDTLDTRDRQRKSELINKTKNYLLSHSHIIQKYIDNMDVRDKIKIVTRLKQFKEEEITNKEKNEKNYTKTVFMLALISMCVAAVVGLTNRNETIIIFSFIGITIVTVLMISVVDYIYDLEGIKRETNNINNWLTELKEEDDITKENNIIKQQYQEIEYELDTIKRENKEFKQKNKKLEDELAEVKLTLSNYIK